ncbi:hypothetical protein M422DRAFT_34920 [Sphaerobolus stellatus SS14]|uniref:Unplaced genomic scaffold SPHSTscaffold_120, whole genome shotgun sequence n=1 Tax=Sphaerobolus stellatus (strain SS14) TaxID=990650 RepID=A0A0C9TWM2_SPHS4|nr:hypothetical protein M422DRAFT_34920 [Sphaerobolus stellatus SS14]
MPMHCPNLTNDILQHGYTTLLTALQRTLHSVLSARILLHLREAAVLRGMAASGTTTYSYRGPDGYFTSEMGAFSTGRGQPVRSIGWDFNNGRKSPGFDTIMSGRSYGRNFSLESICEESPIDSESGLIPREIGPEELFGDKEEGQKPETVIWFGDTQALAASRRVNGDVELQGAPEVETRPPTIVIS